jgi:DNA-binding CsgD family transcriptional regulator
MSGGTPVALAYAADHPERVDRLILYGGVSAGSYDSTPSDAELAFRAMIRAGWGDRDSSFRRFFTTRFIPAATEEQLGWFDELQRMSTSTENAVNSRIARWGTDVRHRLPEISAPTLVLTAVGDVSAPLEGARDLAAKIPNARLVPLASSNHILLANEPAWRVFMSELSSFMLGAEDPRSTEDGPDRIGQLSARERQVLNLAADGRTNAEIAEILVLSVRTVERHLSNAYLKLGVVGRAARTAAVASLLRQDRA